MKLSPKLQSENLKKAAPNIIKAYIHILISFIMGYWVAKEVVVIYGGVWPSVADSTILVDLLSQFSLETGFGATVLAFYEILRPRKSKKI